MADYDATELQRLIQQYQDDMMERYALDVVVQDTATSNREEDIVSISTMTSTEETADETDIGTLQVRVSTENRAVPIVGAVVTVTREQNGATVLVRTMITDESGLTPLIDLQTKERALSLVPGNEQPFSTYSINVAADGYYPKRFTDIPIYGGVTAIQSVSMIPLPEGGDDDIMLVYPQGAPTIT